MSDINDVRERLGRDAADPAIPYTVVCAGSDIRTLLDDHARLQAEVAQGASQFWADIEHAAVARYRSVPDGPFGYRVAAGDGDRSLYKGTKDECHHFVRKLTEAFLDGAHVAYEIVLPLRADHARRKALIDAQANNLNEQLGISEELPPAIDLEQFRVAVGYMIDCAETDSELSHVRRLLALIDGQVHPKRDLFVVWNSARNEGFVTSNKRDAEWVASGRNRPFATPTVGEAFREAYADDGICPVEVICLPRKDEAQHD